MQTKKWENDISVLLVFFARPETFKEVFESVRKARPRRLLLWQDGPREENFSDVENIKKCREIAENIDWECEVYKNYHEENIGCDPSTYMAFKWAFSIVDKCIILEDDFVPSQSYFKFCKELLDKYENDERISHICGFNYFGTADWCPNDYFFAQNGSGAWASWKRVADRWDENYSYFKDEYLINNLKYKYGKNAEKRLLKSRVHAASGIAYWETIIGLFAQLDSKYAIIPKVNLVQNIGYSQNATHTSINDPRLLTKLEKRIYNNKAGEVTFPLKHPQYVQLDAMYDSFLNKRRKNSYTALGRFKTKIGMALRAIRYGRFDVLIKKLKGK